jgi:hypothetical protein
MSTARFESVASRGAVCKEAGMSNPLATSSIAPSYSHQFDAILSSLSLWPRCVSGEAPA